MRGVARIGLFFVGVATGCGFDSQGMGSAGAETLGAGTSATTSANPTPTTTSSADTTSGGSTTATNPLTATSASSSTTDPSGDPSSSSTTDALTTGSPACSDGGQWVLPQWTRRIPLSVDNTGLRTPLTEVPLLIRLPAEAFDPEATLPGGDDLRFVDGNSQQLLAYEIDRWTAGTVSFVWVKLNDLPSPPSSPPRVWMYYGNPSADRGSQASEVWSDGFVSVHHLQNRSDSTGNGHDAISSAGPGTTNAQIARGNHWDDNNEYLELPPESAFDFTSSLTVELWMRVDGWNNNWEALVTKGDSTWRLHRDNNNGFLAWDLNGTDQNGELNGTTIVDDDQWHYVVGTYDGLNMSLYVDGVQDSSLAFSGTIATDDRPVYIGQNEQHGNRDYRHRADEVRVSSVGRTAPWIAFQYRSMTDQVVTFGPEQTCEP